MTNHGIGTKAHSAFIEAASNLILFVNDLKQGHSALIGSNLEAAGPAEWDAVKFDASAAKVRRLRRGLITAGVARLRTGLDCEPSGRALTMQMLTLLHTEDQIPFIAPGAGATAILVLLNDENGVAEFRTTPIDSLEPLLERDDAGIIQELKVAPASYGDPQEDREPVCNLVICCDSGSFERQALSVRHSDVERLLQLARRKLGETGSQVDLTTLIATAIADYQHAVEFSGLHLPPVLLHWRKKRRLLAAYMLVILQECNQLGEMLANPSTPVEIVL
jgi:hypothetical protein